MINLHRRPGICLAIIAGLAWPSCGPANPAGRVAVSGQVTLDGAPVDEGMIEFAPRNQPLGSGATITAGTYSIDAHRGLPPGTYTVRIFAPKQFADGKPIGPNDAPDSATKITSVERVAPRFNSKSELTVDVPAGGKAQVFNFSVSDK